MQDNFVYSESLGFWTLSFVRNYKYRKHNVSETESLSVFRLREGDNYSVGSLRNS
jgi:hypothetical protein